MWMTRSDAIDIDFAAARDEGLEHLDRIAANYAGELPLSKAELYAYLSTNITYSIDKDMQAGLDLYIDLAAKNGLISERRPLALARKR
jgi:predicted solute-binding protein